MAVTAWIYWQSIIFRSSQAY